MITNYSGPAAFVSADNAYPISVASVHDNGQAEPSLPHLQQLMAHAYSHPDEVLRKGRR
jgi:hypothetical protein